MALIASLLVALTQEPGDPAGLPALSLAEPAVQYVRLRPDVQETFALLPRVSGIHGRLDGELDLDYQDLWKTGGGLALEGSLMFPLERDWSLGLSFLTGVEVYGGDRTRDVDGDLWKAESLALGRFMLGLKVMHAPEKGLFFDGRIGLGTVFYSEGRADLVLGGTEVDVTLFEASAALAAEVAVHVGYSAPQVWISAGPSIRFQGAPEESSDFPLVDTDDPVVLAFEIEVGLRF